MTANDSPKDNLIAKGCNLSIFSFFNQLNDCTSNLLSCKPRSGNFVLCIQVFKHRFSLGYCLIYIDVFRYNFFLRYFSYMFLSTSVGWWSLNARFKVRILQALTQQRPTKKFYTSLITTWSTEQVQKILVPNISANTKNQCQISVQMQSSQCLKVLHFNVSREGMKKIPEA